MAMALEDDRLEPLCSGFYMDSEGRLYMSIREFLAYHRLPNVPAIRTMLKEEIAEVFSPIEVIDMPE
jgi:hypothetical protein